MKLFLWIVFILFCYFAWHHIKKKGGVSAQKHSTIQAKKEITPPIKIEKVESVLNGDRNLTKEEIALLAKEVIKSIKPPVLTVEISGDYIEQQSADTKEYKISLKEEITPIRLPEFPVEFNKVYKSNSFTEDTISYQVNIFELSCTCPDFTKRRFEYEKTDYKRLCKHLSHKLRVLKSQLNLSEEQLHLMSYAARHNETLYRISLRNGRFSGRDIIVGWSENNMWVTVICALDKSQQIFRDYGFNLVEKRWSYGNSPIGIANETREILNNMFEIRCFDEV